MPTKKINLTYNNLELILGNRRVPNIDKDIDIEPENVYTLSTVTKINNNPNKDLDENVSSSESHEEPEQRTCVQQ